MPEKAVYSLTVAGEEEFERLMLDISRKTVNIFLDFNAVAVNLDHLPEESQRAGTYCEGVSLFQIPSVQDVYRGGGDAALRIYNQAPAYEVCGLRTLRRRR